MAKSFRELFAATHDLAARLGQAAHKYLLAPLMIVGLVAACFVLAYLGGKVGKVVEDGIDSVGKFVEMYFPVVADQMRLTTWQLGTATILVAVAVYLLWAIPLGEVEKVQARSGLTAEETMRLEIEARKLEYEKRKTLAQILGGGLVLITIYFTYRGFQLSEDKQTTELFTKAVDQLGSTTPATRIGGIYGLERIAYDSPRDHLPIMEILVAYVREPSAILPPNDDGAVAAPLARPSATVQAAISVLGRRNLAHEVRPANERQNARRPNQLLLDLSDCNLRSLRFFQANFENANFARCHLEQADFNGANLSRAYFVDAHLQGAWFYKTNLNDANLRGAHLEGAHFEDVDVFGTDFLGADMTGTHLEGARLSGAVNLSKEQIEKAKTDDRTVMPNRYDDILRDLQQQK